VPILINVFHGDPAVMVAIGMFFRLLRDIDDADGGQLQHGAGRTA
jgi:hypothetical protein